MFFKLINVIFYFIQLRAQYVDCTINSTPLVTTTTVATTSSMKCTVEGAQIPDPKVCTSFYRCVSGVYVAKTCPTLTLASTVFDINVKDCVTVSATVVKQPGCI